MILQQTWSEEEKVVEKFWRMSEHDLIIGTNRRDLLPKVNKGRRRRNSLLFNLDAVLASTRTTTVYPNN